VPEEISEKLLTNKKSKKNGPKNIVNLFKPSQFRIKHSNSVLPVTKRPEDYINYGRQIPALNLTNTTPEHLLKIIKKFQPKNSVDIQGVSTRMIKAIGPEIEIPLTHIFNLSLSTGNFPSKLKQCRVIPIFKAGDQLECDNYRLYLF
jgi:hypothetical protein